MTDGILGHDCYCADHENMPNDNQVVTYVRTGWTNKRLASVSRRLWSVIASSDKRGQHLPGKDASSYVRILSHNAHP